MAEMSNQELCKIVDRLVKDCEQYRRETSPDRVRAMEYFDGVMKDTPSDDGRSQVVSRDVRSHIKKVLPSIVRIILGNDKVVEFSPVSEGDDQMADQATDYINFLAFPESDGPHAVYDAIDDSLRLRNGIIKWWQDKRVEVRYSEHTGLDDAAFAELVSGDDVEVLAHTASVEKIEANGQSIDVPAHAVKIKRRCNKSRPKLAAVQLDNFLVHPDAVTLQDSPIVGENCRMRRSDLIAMGYDRDKIDALPMATGESIEEANEETTRRREVHSREDSEAKAMQEIEYYELLVRVDFDDDGIAELRRIVFAGGLSERFLLENEPWDEVNYADIVCERRPHQWEGNSITDDVADIQRIKTVLLRQTLDNLYWQNNQQPIVQEAAITNPEAVTNPTFGQPILVKQGTDVRSAVGYNTVPFVAEKSYSMLQYMDEEGRDRTGISDASGGLPPDALQNMTAKASAMIEQGGIGQTEMMVRCIAACLRPVFRGLLKLVIQHQDKPRTVRLRNSWVEFDPRTWNADMDASVNTGLGAGTRERDMMMMQIVGGLQEKLLAAFGAANNPYVTPDNLYNVLAKQVEAAGLKSVDLYFSKPTPEQIQKLIDQKANQPSPEQEKTRGAVEVETVKGQIQLQLKDKDIEKEASKEREQRDADLIIKQAELEKETTASMHQATLRSQSDAEQRLIEREKIASNERIALAKIASDQEIAREQMDREDARAVADRESRIQQAQAASIGKAFEKNERVAEMAQ